MPVTITDATTEFVSMAEVKRHLNISDNDLDGDEEIELIRSAAQEYVENVIGPILHRTVVETVYPGGGYASLSVRPILSVTSVTVGGTVLGGYTPDITNGVLRDVYAYAPTVVTYRAGRDSCPDSVRRATLIVAAALWRDQLGGSPSALPDDESASLGFNPDGGDMPERAKALLRPYMRLLPGIA